MLQKSGTLKCEKVVKVICIFFEAWKSVLKPKVVVWQSNISKVVTIVTVFMRCEKVLWLKCNIYSSVRKLFESYILIMFQCEKLVAILKCQKVSVTMFKVWESECKVFTVRKSYMCRKIILLPWKCYVAAIFEFFECQCLVSMRQGIEGLVLLM